MNKFIVQYFHVLTGVNRGEYGKIDLCLLAKPSGPKLSIVTHGMCEGHTMLGLGRYGPKWPLLGAKISHFFPKLTFDPWG